MAASNPQNESAALAAALGIASLVLLFSTVLMIQLLSIGYGAGAGAQIQSVADSRNVTSILQPTVAALNSLYTTILTSYAMLIVTFAMFLAAALLYRHRENILGQEAKTYSILHSALTLVYLLIFLANLGTASLAISSNFLALVYIPVFVCITVDSYMIISRYLFPRKVQSKREDISMDPAKPYTNLLKIKYGIFSRLSGSIGIVDKHMNSIGIENLHRLIQGNMGNINSIDILTSRDMLDSEFWRNYLDCKSEAENSGVKLNVMVMKDEDASEQHERFVFDDRSAYKVPPFNIIHKKSEHITGIKVSDARKRFGELYKRSTKYENFVSKEGAGK